MCARKMKNMHVVIFAGGTVRPGKALSEAMDSADMCIAADKGAATALQYECTPRIVIGDFDSLDKSLVEELRKRGCEIRQAAVEKNETDTELAVQAAIDEGATRITLVGALGGARIDHEMANILLLAGFKDVPFALVDGPSICWIMRGPGNAAIEGKKGDLVSLLPLTGDASGIRTEGLYYPLKGETLAFGKSRGVSNVLAGEHAVVSVENGILLVIHTNVEELNE